MKNIGAYIAELRQQHGLTQKQVAKKLNISNKTMSSWETGKTMPDIDLLPTLADLYGVSCDEILRGGEPNICTGAKLYDEDIDKGIKNISDESPAKESLSDNSVEIKSKSLKIKTAYGVLLFVIVFMSIVSALFLMFSDITFISFIPVILAAYVIGICLCPSTFKIKEQTILLQLLDKEKFNFTLSVFAISAFLVCFSQLNRAIIISAPVLAGGIIIAGKMIYERLNPCDNESVGNGQHISSQSNALTCNKIQLTYAVISFIFILSSFGTYFCAIAFTYTLSILIFIFETITVILFAIGFLLKPRNFYMADADKTYFNKLKYRFIMICASTTLCGHIIIICSKLPLSIGKIALLCTLLAALIAVLFVLIDILVKTVQKRILSKAAK